MQREQSTSMLGTATRRGAGCSGQIALLGFALGLAVVLVFALVRTFDPMEREARAQQLYRQEQLQEDLYWADQLAGALWRLTPAMAIAIIGLGGATVVLIIAYRQLAAWQTIRANKMIALTRAQVQRFPEGLQTLAFHDSSREVPQLAPPAWGDEKGDDEADDARDLEGAPPFEELLSEFGPGRPRVLGRDLSSGELVRLPVEDLFNIGLGGTSGAGKSWTAAALAAQHILAGGKLIIIDPHGRKTEGLTPRLLPFAPAFFCKPAIDEPDIKAVASMVRAEVERRRSGRPGKPWLVVIDEYARLMRSTVAEEVGRLVEELGQEGRGFGVTALVSSQIWNGTRAGGSEVRDALSSHIIHRLRPSQARMLTGLPADALPQDLHALPKGHFYLFDANGELRRVAAPRMSEEAIGRVAQLLVSEPLALPAEATGPTIRLPNRASATGTGDGRPTPPANTPGTRGEHVVNTSPDDVFEASGRAGELHDAQITELRAKFAAGATLHELAAELAGTTNTNARAYREARARVEAVLRALLGGES